MTGTLWCCCCLLEEALHFIASRIKGGWRDENDGLWSCFGGDVHVPCVACPCAEHVCPAIHSPQVITRLRLWKGKCCILEELTTWTLIWTRRCVRQVR